jgi:hypothetical protein
LSVMPQCWGGVPSQRNPFTYKYEAQWKNNILI